MYYVTSRDGNFKAILQPIAYYGNPKVDYLNLKSSNDTSLAAQYHAVYPLIIKIAEEQNLNFTELTNIYDDCSNCYIDFCHVGPQAHQILTDYLSTHLTY